MFANRAGLLSNVVESKCFEMKNVEASEFLVAAFLRSAIQKKPVNIFFFLALFLGVRG